MQQPPSLLRNPTTWIRVLAIAFVASVVSACGASTTIEQQWTSPQARAEPPMRRAVVFFYAKSITMRRGGEDRVARELALRGVQATPGYRIFGETQPQDLDSIKQSLAAMGYDGVITMRVVDAQQDVNYVPPTYTGYYWAWGYPYDPFLYDWGYAYTETIVRVETAAYSLRTNRLLWSALTRTIDPSSTTQLIDQTASLVASQLFGIGLTG